MDFVLLGWREWMLINFRFCQVSMGYLYGQGSYLKDRNKTYNRKIKDFLLFVFKRGEEKEREKFLVVFVWRVSGIF